VCGQNFSKKKNEFYEQNEIKTISKSENSIILGISHRDDQINAIVNTILTTTKWMIWKERNVAKYQKKKITKLKIINLIKNEIHYRVYILTDSFVSKK
jgi:hypothetical protein